LKYWLVMAGCWLLFSGVLFTSLVLAMGLPVLVSLAVTVAVVGLTCWYWTREVPAKDLEMRESLWNTPEDDELLT
jgi:hypothetical protein